MPVRAEGEHRSFPLLRRTRYVMIRSVKTNIALLLERVTEHERRYNYGKGEHIGL